MPCFSKPAVLAATALLLSAGVEGREHERLKWRQDKDDKNYFITDLYFRYNGNNQWGYSTGPSNPWWPGCSPLIFMHPGKNYKINVHNYARGVYRSAEVDAAGVDAAGVDAAGDDDRKHATSFGFGGAVHCSREGGYNKPGRIDVGNYMQHQYNIPSYHANGLYPYNPFLAGNAFNQYHGGAYGLMHIGGGGYNVGPQHDGNPYDNDVKGFFTTPGFDRYLSIGHDGKKFYANGEFNGFHETELIMGQFHRMQAGYQWANGLGPQMAQWLPNDACQVYQLGANGNLFDVLPSTAFGRPQYNYKAYSGQRHDWGIQCNRPGRYPAYQIGGRVVSWFNVKNNVRPNGFTPFNKRNQQWRYKGPNYLANLFNDDRPRVVTTVGSMKSFKVDDSHRFQLDGKYANNLGFNVPFGQNYINNFQFNNMGKQPFGFGFNNFLQIMQPGGCGDHHPYGSKVDHLWLMPGQNCRVAFRCMDYSGRYPFWSNNYNWYDQGAYNWLQTPFGAPGSFEAMPGFRNSLGQRRSGNRREDMSEVEDANTIPQSTWIIAGASIAATAFGIIASVLVVRRRRAATPDAGFQEMECQEVTSA